MATLNDFKYSNDVKPIRQPAVIQRRNKLISRLWEQIQLLKSIENGTEFTVKKLKSVKDHNGNVKREHMPKRLKPWWFTNLDGQLCVSIRYGSKYLEIKHGMRIIQAVNNHELLEILETVKKAVADGELDALIEQAGGTLLKNFQGNDSDKS
jgi:hypothetical protein